MKKILVVVDYQNDFVDPQGSLPVPNAEKIWKNIQKKINDKNYESIIYTFDTHTSIEYNNSEEQKLFPNIHCEFGKNGWNLFKIKPRNNDKFIEAIKNLNNPFSKLIINDEYFFTKNEFDIWNGNKEYSEFFINKFPNDEFEIDVVGVAQNYCVFMNIMGLIERKYKVNLIQNCVEGIKYFPDGSVDNSYENNNKIMINNNVNFLEK